MYFKLTNFLYFIKNTFSQTTIDIFVEQVFIISHEKPFDILVLISDSTICYHITVQRAIMAKFFSASTNIFTNLSSGGDMRTCGTEL